MLYVSHVYDNAQSRRFLAATVSGVGHWLRADSGCRLYGGRQQDFECV
jgi:hypothetical protein